MLLIKLIRTKPVVQGFIQRKGKSVFRHADKKNKRNPFFVVVVLWIRVFVGSDRLMQKKRYFPIYTNWMLNNLAAAAGLGAADGLQGNADNSAVIFHIVQSIIFKD